MSDFLYELGGCSENMEENMSKEVLKLARVPAWSDSGKEIRNATSVAEAIKLANLDYEVEKKQVYLENGFKVDGQFATVKKGTNSVFGIVGKDFQIVQNKEAFSFVDSLCNDGWKFERAGENKSFNWLIASMPEVSVLGDPMAPFIILQNSHCGGSALRASISPLRILCSNQFTIAWSEAKSKVSLRHTAGVKDQMDSALQVMSLSRNHMKALKKNAEVLAVQKVSENDVKKVMELTFPVTEEMTDRMKESAESNKRDFIVAYNQPDIANFKGTKWGMLNAYSDFITHKPSKNTEKSRENKFLKVTLDTSILENFISMLASV